MTIEPSEQEALQQLKTRLGDNLYSVCLYGSAVRGNSIPTISDANLLVVLRRSDATAHGQVAAAIGGNPRIQPFILALPGFERSVRAFAAKFSSIRRHYRVLYGADPLADIVIPPDLERFLCEQALRNLQLRLAHTFITREQHQTYSQFLVRSVMPLFLRLSEVLRLDGIELPLAFEERVEPVSKHLSIDSGTLSGLLILKSERRKLSDEEIVSWHERVIAAVNHAVEFVDAQWPPTKGLGELNGE